MIQYKVMQFERPSKEIIDRFARLGTAAIADAMGRYGGMDPEIKAVTASEKLCGPALTVRTYRSDNLFLHVGLEAAEAGDVLVADAGGVKNAGVWGDLMTEMAVQKKLSGVVIDGAVRDKADIIKSGLPVFARQVCPMGGFKEISGAVNVNISCGSVSVKAGDLVIGDEDGIVVVPREELSEVLRKAEKIAAGEEAIRERMAAGETLFHILKLDQKVQL